MGIRSWSCALLAVCLLAPASRAAEVLTLSMLPRHDPAEIQRRIAPLAAYLSQALGTPVTPLLTRDYTDYEQRLRRGEIAIGYQNPVVTVRVAEVHEVLGVAVDPEDGDRFRGLVVTAHDSPIQSLDDLRGRTVCVVGRTSAGGYLSPRLTLLRRGIAVPGDCRLLEAVGNQQENVLFAVHAGEADAGFIKESALHMADRFLPPGRIRVLAEGEWLPNYALTMRRDLAPAVKSALQEAACRMPPGHPALQALGLKAFRPGADADYASVREALPEADRP